MQTKCYTNYNQILQLHTYDIKMRTTTILIVKMKEQDACKRCNKYFYTMHILRQPAASLKPRTKHEGNRIRYYYGALYMFTSS